MRLPSKRQVLPLAANRNLMIKPGRDEQWPATLAQSAILRCFFDNVPPRRSFSSDSWQTLPIIPIVRMICAIVEAPRLHMRGVEVSTWPRVAGVLGVDNFFYSAF